MVVVIVSGLLVTSVVVNCDTSIISSQLMLNSAHDLVYTLPICINFGRS